MFKRLKWSVKIGCLFLVLACLWFNEPLTTIYKKAVAESFKRNLALYQKPPEGRELPASGKIVRLVLPKPQASFDVGQLYLAHKPQFCSLWRAQDTNAAIISSGAGNVDVDIGAPILSADLKLGDVAYILTDNGHRFVYQLKLVIDLTDDFSIPDNGPPTMTLQSCAGNRSELFLFNLWGVQ